MPIAFWWSVVAAAVAFVGLAKSGFGGGLGLLAVPVVTLSLARVPELGAGAAPGFLLPLLVLGDLLAVWQYRRLFDGGIVRRLALGSVVGLVLGGLLLAWFHHLGNEHVVGSVISIEIGVESVFLIGLQWWRQIAGIPRKLMREPARGNITGSVAAVSSTLAHGAGPIVATYLLPLGLDRKQYVGTTAMYFFLLNSAKLPVYALAGQLHFGTIGLSARCIPALATGAIFGRWVNRRLSDKVFLQFVYAATFVLGWYVLYEGISGLLRE